MSTVTTRVSHRNSWNPFFLLTLSLHPFSQWRYWLLLLVTLILNILFIIYFNPDDSNSDGSGQNGTAVVELVCPRIYSFESEAFNEALVDEYVVSTFVLGSLYLLLAIWMILEYFIVTWPHFVLPRFLYTYCDKLEKYRLTRPLSR